MAKAKSGGTRALIRGRVASDVYSIGKDGKGSRQQIVRSAPEQVSNPRTRSQVEQRVKMKAVTRMLSLVKPIVDHSWEGVDYGQLSVSEFIRQSLANINTWVDNGHTPDTYLFLGQSEQGVAAGTYPLSSGSLNVPSSLYSFPVDAYTAGVPDWVDDGILYETKYGILIALPAKSVSDGQVGSWTLGELRTALGLADNDYITYCILGKDIDGSMSFFYERFYFKGGDDSTVLSSDNIASFFETEGNLSPWISLQGASSGGTGNGGVFLSFRDSSMLSDWEASGVNLAATIVSRKLANGSWARNNSAFQIGKLSSEAVVNQLGSFYIENAGSLWDDVFDEWEIGSVRFLNGGSLE